MRTDFSRFFRQATNDETLNESLPRGERGEQRENSKVKKNKKKDKVRKRVGKNHEHGRMAEG